MEVTHCGLRGDLENQEWDEIEEYFTRVMGTKYGSICLHNKTDNAIKGTLFISGTGRITDVCIKKRIQKLRERIREAGGTVIVRSHREEKGFSYQRLIIQLDVWLPWPELKIPEERDARIPDDFELEAAVRDASFDEVREMFERWGLEVLRSVVHSKDSSVGLYEVYLGGGIDCDYPILVERKLTGIGARFLNRMRKRKCQ